jgi:hypothetical protein
MDILVSYQDIQEDIEGSGKTRIRSIVKLVQGLSLKIHFVRNDLKVDE